MAGFRGEKCGKPGAPDRASNKIPTVGPVSEDLKKNHVQFHDKIPISVNFSQKPGAAQNDSAGPSAP
jgi:hypothetical protein